MYRFLLTPKWLGFAALMLAMSVVMIGLSDWQLHRYHFRHGINVRIERAKTATAIPLTSAMDVDRPVATDREWTKVTATGTYAAAKTVVARERTVDGTVGFEIITPLVLTDGSVVMIDRGFLAGDTGGSRTLPQVPPVPSGVVTVTGRIHSSESEPDRPTTINGQLTFRRVAPSSVRADLGYAHLYPDYVLLDTQTPKGAGAFTTVPSDTQPAWMNAGYTIQWAGFALIPLFGFWWQARKDARDRSDGGGTTTTESKPRSRDRVPEEPDPVSAGI